MDQQRQISRRLTIRTKCGTCVGLECKLPGFDAPCVDLGKTTASVTCKQYTPDPQKIIRFLSRKSENPNLFSQLSRLIQSVDHNARQILAYYIANSTELERVTEQVSGVKLKFGHPIAVMLGGRDYISNWYSGKVCGITPNHSHLIIVAKMRPGKRGQKSYWASLKEDIKSLSGGKRKTKRLINVYPTGTQDPKFDLPPFIELPPTLMTKAAFLKHKKKLLRMGKIKAPGINQFKTWKLITKDQLAEKAKKDTYIPPSLDDAPAEWLDDRSDDIWASDLQVTQGKFGKIVSIG